MTNLFEPAQAGDIALANRVVMAPLTRNRSPGEVPNDLNVTYYRQRASAGLIVSEGTAITQQGQGYAHVPGLYKPEALAGWKKVTDAVHDEGGKIVAQIWHVGRISHTSLQPAEGKPVAPSAITAKSKTYIINEDGSGAFAETSAPRALDTSDISAILEDYRKAARFAIDAGFDGVEIHAANGYLIEQFLKSSANQRTDNYGGSIENRARFLLEVVDTVTKEIGAGRTGIRLSPVTPANDIAEPAPQPLYEYVVKQLGGRGLSFIHVVEGATGGPRDLSESGSPFDYDALRAAYVNAGGKGLWIANNGYTRETAIEAVANGKADAIAFGRPFIANPDLVRRLKENAELNALQPDKLYGGGAEGYTDYPALA
ncbi:alkene reductase [Agrobacterium sp.]|jgi:N-ethylmaleimide reductase|uniref:alkene reductase n=1 Tax=Agrobacterium sp. TaxID=361 RepID=UPI0028AF72B9|nr:alkene reductase [Agrobacterium sp.]